MHTRILVTARDRRGKALALHALRATYEEATARHPLRPHLHLEMPHGPTATPAEAQAQLKLAARANRAVFAALLHGLLETTRLHRNLELRVEAPGVAGSPFARGVVIHRGAFDREEAASWLDATDAGQHAAEDVAPAAGAEQIGNLGELATLLAGLPWALGFAGNVYVPDGRETARRITPPGRFSPGGWSADGDKLAVLGATPGGEPSLWISQHGSGAIAAIALETPGAPTAAAFSPDGAIVAVTTNAGRLAVLPADGHSATSISVGPRLKLSDPAWSPDGALVAVVAEDASRARSLHLVSVGEGKKPARILVVEPPAAEDDVGLADPEFSEDGTAVYARALVAPRGEPRVPRLVRVRLDTPGVAEPMGPPLSRVHLKGGASRWRKGRLFVAGVGPHETLSADSEWLDPVTGETTQIPAPKHARLAFGAPDLSVLFVKRMKGATWVWRVRAGDTGKPRRVRLPFLAWLTVP
ncbi:MAG TPA: hypothetical protein VMV18_09215 [bacterium]|nr:hypothetical protein [bacterium]